MAGIIAGLPRQHRQPEDQQRGRVLEHHGVPGARLGRVDLDGLNLHAQGRRDRSSRRADDGIRRGQRLPAAGGSNMAGVMPIIFASVKRHPGHPRRLARLELRRPDVRRPDGEIYTTLPPAPDLLLLLLLEPPDVPAPEDIANNLREHGSFIPGFARVRRPRSIWTRSHPDHPAGAAFLAIVAVVPNFITADTSLTRCAIPRRAPALIVAGA